MKHKDGLTDQEYAELQALAEKHDKKARKDTAINMRVSSDLLDEIKACAKAEGYPRYQTWLTMALEVMVAKSHNRETESTQEVSFSESFEFKTILGEREKEIAVKRAAKQTVAKKATPKKAVDGKNKVSAKSATSKVFKSPV